MTPEGRKSSADAPKVETAPETLESVKAAYEAKREEYDKKMELFETNAGIRSSLWDDILAQRDKRGYREREQEEAQMWGKGVNEQVLRDIEISKTVEMAQQQEIETLRRALPGHVSAADKARHEMRAQKKRYSDLGGDPRDLTPSRFDRA